MDMLELSKIETSALNLVMGKVQNFLLDNHKQHMYRHATYAIIKFKENCYKIDYHYKYNEKLGIKYFQKHIW